ncbi:MAG: hypothetical protein KGI25_06575 [Thaumarchaeota archaeon]|nr:hypothetical protein [Nitrososphaerota archaeon]
MESWAKVSNIPFRRETKGSLSTCNPTRPEKKLVTVLGQLFKNVIEEQSSKRVAIETTDKTVMFRF